MGRCKSKTASDITTQYLWSDSQVMAEYNGSGTLQRKYIYAPTLNPIALVAGGGTNTYIHKDALGSVVALSNSVGTVTDKFKYDTFGKDSNVDSSQIIGTSYR